MMSEAVEDYLLVMKPHLTKISKYHGAMDSKNKKEEKTDGKLELGPVKHKINYNVVTLSSETKSDVGLPSFKKSDRRTSDSNSTTYASMNQEWRTMFAAQDSSQVFYKISLE